MKSAEEWIKDYFPIRTGISTSAVRHAVLSEPAFISIVREVAQEARKEAIEEAVKLVCRFKFKKVCNPYDLTQHDTAETIETEIRTLLNQANKKEE